MEGEYLSLDTTKKIAEKDKEIERLNNKNEELLTLYTTEREVKDYYKNIINELENYMIGKDIYKILLYKLRDLKDSDKE